MAKTEEAKNDYRSERKERIAKAKKKSNKAKRDSTSIIAGIIYGIFGVAVIVGLGFLLNSFGIFEQAKTAVKVNGTSFSVGEYNYYYVSYYNQLVNNAEEQAEQLSQYGLSGLSLGIDSKSHLDAQTIKVEKEDAATTAAEETEAEETEAAVSEETEVEETAEAVETTVAEEATEAEEETAADDAAAAEETEATEVTTETEETTDDGKEEITYDVYINRSVIETFERTAYYLAKADEMGITLNAENQATIEDTIEQYKSSADNYQVSINYLLSKTYGKGVTKKTLEKVLKDQYLVQQVVENIEEGCKSEITDAQIEETYNADPDAYNVVDIRLFGLELTSESSDDSSTEAETEATDDAEASDDAETAETEEATAEEKNAEVRTKCEEYLAKITDEASFAELAKEYCKEDDAETYESDAATKVMNLQKETVSKNIGSDFAEWLFDSERQTGDKRIVETDNYSYVVYVTNPAHKLEDQLVDARHILTSFDNVKSELETAGEEDLDDTTETTATASNGEEISNAGTGYSIKVVLKAYEEACELMEDYGKIGTEDYFAELANDTTKNADSGSNTNGGLYENIKKGTMTAEFENWIYDDSRTAGDTGLVMTQYGWHFMYFVQKHEKASWVEDILDTLASSAVSDIEAENETEYKQLIEDASITDKLSAKACKFVNELIDQNKSNS